MYLDNNEHNFMYNNDSLQFSDNTNAYTPVRDYPIYGS